MLRKLRRFLDLPAGERWQLASAGGALARVSLGLRLFGYRRCLHRLDRRSRASIRGPDPGGPEPAAPEALALAASYARMVRIAAGNLPFRAACLERSVALWWLLRRRRIPAELKIGVRKSPSDQELDAHAWVELGGRPIDDRDDVHQRYAAFDGPASQGSWLRRTPFGSSERDRRHTRWW